MTDVWTSVGVVIGIVVVGVTGWQVLDPVDRHRRRDQYRLDGGAVDTPIHRRPDGHGPARGRDRGDPGRHPAGGGVQHPLHHALRTRKSGSRRFIDFHLLVPGQTTVQASHDLMNRVEAAIEQGLPNAFVIIHADPREDAASWDGDVVGGSPPTGPTQATAP